MLKTKKQQKKVATVTGRHFFCTFVENKLWHNQ